MYSPDAKFPVYKPDVWFGDSWDARDCGREFDFERPFFEQFAELRDEVPHLALVSKNNFNCDYCNIVGDCKDCYLIYGSINCENCYYGNPFNCKYCADSLLLRDSEWCLECSDSDKLYNCYHCRDCSNSHDLGFCLSVKNSSDCFGCVNLNHAQYCFFNEQLSKEEYEARLAEFDKGDVQKVWEKVYELAADLPRRYYVGVNNENVSGDYIFNSKDCFECYGVGECRDCKYCFQMLKVNDAMDINNAEVCELMYEVGSVFEGGRCLFSNYVWDGVDSLIYCLLCWGAKNSFGCVGLHKSEYCILNKQYSKEEYELMLNKIIDHMKKTGEWGEFFPVALSSFAYNETIANEYFTLSKGEVLERGWRWKESEGAENSGATDAVRCEVTGKPFRIVGPEKKLYERFGLKLPKRSPVQRHLDRLGRRNLMQLWEAECDKCGVDLETTYGEENDVKIYCEKCYREEVY